VVHIPFIGCVSLILCTRVILHTTYNTIQGNLTFDFWNLIIIGGSDFWHLILIIIGGNLNPKFSFFFIIIIVVISATTFRGALQMASIVASLPPPLLLPARKYHPGNFPSSPFSLLSGNPFLSKLRFVFPFAQNGFILSSVLFFFKHNWFKSK